MVEKTLLFQRLLTRNVLIRVDVNISTVRKKINTCHLDFGQRRPLTGHKTLSVLSFWTSCRLRWFSLRERDGNSLIYVYKFSVFLKHLCNCSNLSFDEKRVLEGSKWYGLIVRKTVLNAIISHKTFAMIFHLRWKQVWWFFERMFKQLPSISISCETISCSIHPQLF